MTYEAPSLDPVWDATTKRWSDDEPRTDAEKHAFCKRRTGVEATYINQAQFDHFKREGVDMRYYVVIKPIPDGIGIVKFVGTNDIGPAPSSMTVQGEITGRFDGCFHRGHRVKKFVREKPVCSGKDVRCLPGKDGRCVACTDDD